MGILSTRKKKKKSVLLIVDRIILFALIATLATGIVYRLLPPDPIQHAVDSTVVLFRESPEGYEVGTCSGTVISRHEDNYRVLTAAHCVGTVEDIPVFDPYTRKILGITEYFQLSRDVMFVGHDTTSERIPTTVVIVGNHDVGLDYAVLSFHSLAPFSVAQLNYAPLKPAEKVFSVGFPEGRYKLTLFGVVARTSVNLEIGKNLLTIQLPGSGNGSSGSAIFDESGKIRAVLVRGFDRPPGLAISIPVYDLLLGNL